MNLRIVEREWFDRGTWALKYGYDVVFHNGVVLLRRVGDEFRGPNYLLSLFSVSDGKEAVLGKCQDWVNHHQTKVKTELRRARSLQGDTE